MAKKPDVKKVVVVETPAVIAKEETQTSAPEAQMQQSQDQQTGDAAGQSQENTSPVVEDNAAAGAEQTPGAEAGADAGTPPEGTGTPETTSGDAVAVAPEAVVAVAPVVETPPVVVEEVKQTQEAPEAPEAPKGEWPEVTGIADVDRLLKNVPATSLAPIHRLIEYIANMHPKKPLAVEEGARQQVGLFKVIQNVINREDQHFRPLFAAILALFDAHKAGVFHEANVFRFMEHIALNDNERKAFQRLLNLIKVTANRESRGVSVKQINFTDSLRYGLTDEGRQRVLEFFQVGN